MSEGFLDDPLLKMLGHELSGTCECGKAPEEHNFIPLVDLEADGVDFAVVAGRGMDSLGFMVAIDPTKADIGITADGSPLVRHLFHLGVQEVANLGRALLLWATVNDDELRESLVDFVAKAAADDVEEGLKRDE